MTLSEQLEQLRVSLRPLVDLARESLEAGQRERNLLLELQVHGSSVTAAFAQFSNLINQVDALQNQQADLLETLRAVYIDIELDRFNEEFVSDRVYNVQKEVGKTLGGYGIDPEQAFKDYMDKYEPGWDDPDDEEAP